VHDQVSVLRMRRVCTIRYCHAAGTSSDSSQGLKDWDSVIAAAAEFLEVCWFGMTYGGFCHGVVVFFYCLCPLYIPTDGVGIYARHLRNLMATPAADIGRAA
jgi:hypothetical protein